MLFEVYYHLFIPPTQNFTMWTWWVDEQLGLLERSGITHVARVFVAITGPVHYATFGPHPTLEPTVRSYIAARYPFATVLDFRDTSAPNLFEGNTLRFVHQACVERGVDVLYFHSKGVTSMSPYVANWRQMLNHYVINQWETCWLMLDNVDVVGVADRQSEVNQTLSGNFWWARGKYIRSLPDPLNSAAYDDRPSFHPGQGDYRYAFEKWITSGNPTIGYIKKTGREHFDQYYFLEHEASLVK